VILDGKDPEVAETPVRSRARRVIDSKLVVKFLRMSGRYGVISSYGVLSMMACGPARPVPATPSPGAAARPAVRLAVIPADSDAFPRAARAVSASLSSVQIAGVDATAVSRVSLEVVQLSIECVDPIDACYQAIGRSMSANRLLFARIDPGATRRQLRVTVTLYDVDAGSAKRTAARLFPTEDQAVAGAASLVAEATR
jgi:hypothetical protein